jgi:hypothetical protein
MPVSVEVGSLPWMVKLSEVDPPNGMLAAPNDLLSIKGPVTTTWAVTVC